MTTQYIPLAQAIFTQKKQLVEENQSYVYIEH